MKGEIQKALNSMKDGKATGTDDLPAEALKALDEQNIEIITSLCNIIYNSGMIPTEMKHSVFITLPKKPKATVAEMPLALVKVLCIWRHVLAVVVSDLCGR